MPEGVQMSKIENALEELREKCDRAQTEVEKLNKVISGIESLNGAEPQCINSITTKNGSGAKGGMGEHAKGVAASSGGDENE
jgi:fructose-bisphosphate aldolase class 1